MGVFVSLFTLFVLLGGGYFAKRIGILKQRQSRTFLDFAIIFALPCLIFDRMYHLELDFSLIVLIFMGLASCLISALLVLFTAYLCKFSKATLVSIFLLSSLGNTLFVGIPVVSGLYANEERFISEIILYDAIATALPASLFAPFIVSLASDIKPSLAQNFKKLISFPPFIALVGGFVCKLIVLPEFLFAPIRAFGSAATTIALFAIGVGLSFSAIKSAYKSTALVIFAKMILAPLIFIFLLWLFKFEFSKSVVVAIVESATPTMTLAAALIMKAKLDSNLAVSSVAFGILFCFVNMSVLSLIFA